MAGECDLHDQRRAHRRRAAAAALLPPTTALRGEDGTGRFASLDALRGIAALLIVTFHCWKIGLFPEPVGWVGRLWYWTPLNLLISGRPWVILFFVLSGFVLACSLERAMRLDYRGFVLRRLCRIYLPFLGSILLSLLAYALVQPERIASLSRWFNELAWSEPPTLRMVMRHLLMTGLDGDDGLNPVMWSLVYELRISLVFPALFLAGWRWPRALLAIGLLAHLAAAVLFGCRSVQCQPFRGHDGIGSMLLTVYFTLFFIIGILLARYRDGVTQAVRRLSVPGAALLGLAALYAMILPNNPRLMAFLPADLLAGLGGAALMALAIGRSGWAATLRLRPLAWLGLVSYSLYLTHNIVLLALMHWFHAMASVTVLLLGVVVASLLVAAVSHRLLEAPAARLGRWVTERRGGDALARNDAAHGGIRAWAGRDS
jgi:peptidoglycan/LPS O-acetylase OafA/YrhL